jgi:hypothetical protein
MMMGICHKIMKTAVEKAKDASCDYGIDDIQHRTMFASGYLQGYNEAMRCQSTPKIKQLEWVEVLEGYEVAKTPFGYYVVRPSIDNKEFRMVNLRKITQTYSTLSEAKAAAQADFEQRVRECLDLKARQKQALIDMMRGDEEIGLYDDNPKNH